MKLTFVLSIILVLQFLGASETSAQSMWLHKQLYTAGTSPLYGIRARDSANFVLSPGAFSPASTHNYGSSWEYIFVGSRLGIYDIPCFEMLSENTILLGSNAGRTYFIHNGNSTTILQIEAGIIFRTTNGGRTWADTAIGSRDTTKVHNPIGAMAALDSLHVFLPIGADHYLHSTDGGLSWKSISSPVTSHYAWSDYDIVNPIAAYPAPNTLIVSEVDSIASERNYVSKIYRSTDLGRTWNTGFRMPGNLTDIKFEAPLIGYATGYSLDTGLIATSMIFKTTDGGVTWRSIYNRILDVSSALFGIAFADAQHGFAVGGNGTVLRTSDAGSSWNGMKSDFSRLIGDNTLFGVAYPDSMHAMIASGSGDVLIYRPDTLLDFPEIIVPAFGQALYGTFEASWKPVAGATKYRIKIAPESSNPKMVLDTIVSATSLTIALSNPAQYTFYISAFNDLKTSNQAVQPFYRLDRQSVTTPIAPVKEKGSLTLYPNPANSIVHCMLQSPGSGPIAIEIDDLLGRKIVEPGYRHGSIGTNGDLRFDVDLGGLRPGNYLLRLKGVFGEISKQVVVTH